MPYASVEKRRERAKQWKKANPEKVREYKRRYRERQKAKAARFLINERVHPLLRVCDAQKGLLDVALVRLRKEKEKKEGVKRKEKEKKQGVQRKQKKQRKEKQVQTNEPPPCLYCTQRKVAIPRRPVQPVSTVTVPSVTVRPLQKDCDDCGLCFSCGGFPSRRKSVDYEWVRDKKVVDGDSMSFTSCSSSEVDDEWADRLDALLNDDFSSGEEEGVKAVPSTPLRRSSRLAEKPRADYGDEVEEYAERVRDLHKQAVETTVKRWENEEFMSEILRDLQPLDPHRELDRFAAKLAREVTPVRCFNEETPLEYTVDTELFDLIEQQLNTADPL